MQPPSNGYLLAKKYFLVCFNTNGSVNLIKGMTIGYRTAEIYAKNPRIFIKSSY